MKRIKQIIILLCGIVFFYCNANAQISAQLVGKKFQVVCSSKTTATISQNGNATEVPMSTGLYVTYEIKSVAGKTVQLSVMLDRIKSSTYDSDDSAVTASYPQLADRLNLHKVQDFTVEVGKMPDMDMANIELQNLYNVLSPNALFNPFDKSATEGSKFSDSTKSESGLKSITDYVVSKINDSEITVIATTNTNISKTNEEIKMNTQAKSVSTRIYDASSGLLKTATTDADTSSKQKISGVSISGKIKSTSTTTVQ